MPGQSDTAQFHHLLFFSTEYFPRFEVSEVGRREERERREGEKRGREERERREEEKRE